MAKFMLDLCDELRNKVKFKSLKMQKTMNDVIVQAIKEFLK